MIEINKSNKITIIGYIVSLLSFIGAFFFFISKVKDYGDMFLVSGGIILTVTIKLKGPKIGPFKSILKYNFLFN